MIVLTHVFYTFTPCSPGTTLFINLFTINLKLPPRFLPCLYKVITLYYPYIITIITSLQSIPTYVVVGSTLGLESPLFYLNLFGIFLKLLRAFIMAAIFYYIQVLFILFVHYRHLLNI